MKSTSPDSTPRWLLLVHQIPQKPSYFRAKVGRRLHTIGAVALKNSVYVLPLREQTQEDFQWAPREIIADGGDEKFGRAEAPGGAALIAGIALSRPEDEPRVEAGTVLLDSLLAFLGKQRS